MRFFKRGDVWYCWFFDNQGRRIKRTTQCTDRRAAEARAREWERDAADPDHAAKKAASLGEALKTMLDAEEAHAKAGRRSDDTVDCYKVKAGHWVRLLETNAQVGHAPLPLAEVDARRVDRYIATRREEGVGDGTIHKELTVLRKALKLAKRHGLWDGDLAKVLPTRFSPAYEPVERWLPREEVDLLMKVLPRHRAAVVAFIVATSAEWGCVVRARREDLGTGNDAVALRGTKNPRRWRKVPVLTQAQSTMLDFARKNADGVDGLLFSAWGNVRRDLHDACRRVGCLRTGCVKEADATRRSSCTRDKCEKAAIAPCSPNDLRRSFAHHHLDVGLPHAHVARMMGHRDSRMVERVYGRLDDEELLTQATAHVRPEHRLQQPEPRGTHLGQTPRSGVDSLDSLDPLESQFTGDLVPRDRVELPTRGFSSRIGMRARGLNPRRIGVARRVPSQIRHSLLGTSESAGKQP